MGRPQTEERLDAACRIGCSRGKAEGRVGSVVKTVVSVVPPGVSLVKDSEPEVSSLPVDLWPTVPTSGTSVEWGFDTSGLLDMEVWDPSKPEFVASEPELWVPDDKDPPDKFGSGGAFRYRHTRSFRRTGQFFSRRSFHSQIDVGQQRMNRPRVGCVQTGSLQTMDFRKTNLHNLSLYPPQLCWQLHLKTSFHLANLRDDFVMSYFSVYWTHHFVKSSFLGHWRVPPQLDLHPQRFFSSSCNPSPSRDSHVSLEAVMTSAAMFLGHIFQYFLHRPLHQEKWRSPDTFHRVVLCSSNCLETFIRCAGFHSNWDFNIGCGFTSPEAISPDMKCCFRFRLFIMVSISDGYWK